MVQGGFWLWPERTMGLQQAEPMERGQELQVEKTALAKTWIRKQGNVQRQQNHLAVWEKSERAVLIVITLRSTSLETQLCTPSPLILTLTVELPDTTCGWYNIGDSQSTPGTPETQASGSVKIVPLPHIAIYVYSELNQSLSSSNKYFWSTYHVPGSHLDPGNIPLTKVSLQSSWSLF